MKRSRTLVLGSVLGFASLVGLAPSATAAEYLTPVFECYSPQADGTTRLILGATNTSEEPQTMTGDLNAITPSQYDGLQPSVIKPGVTHGAAVLNVASTETITWVLGSQSVTFDAAEPSTSSVPMCSDGGALPSAGNGLFPPLLTLLVGAVGATVFTISARRLARRSRRSA